MTRVPSRPQANILQSEAVGILGLGQMGGSLARALVHRGIRVVGFDVRRSLLVSSLRSHTISASAASDRLLLDRCSIVILALPMSVTLAFLEKHHSVLRQKLAVIDLASIRTPLSWLSSKLGLKNHVGIHFVCGSEKRGRAAWNEALFSKAPAVFFPQGASSGSIRAARELMATVDARACRMDPHTHDAHFAITSGLPHVLAYTLAETWVRQKRHPKELEGPSFRSTTRVASSDPHIASELLQYNRKHLLNALRKYRMFLDSFERLLRRDDGGRLGKRMAMVYNRMSRDRDPHRTPQPKEHPK